MKTASTFLYDLVHTLTQSEKRYLKVQAGAGEKDYLHLLDALLAQKTFDEQQLVQDHQGANFVRHLAVNKQYLYALLLNKLTQFGQQKLEDQVVAKLAATNVLIEKGLYRAAYHELRKGQQIATQYELFELQMMLCGLEKKLRALQPFKKQDDTHLEQLFKRELDSLAQLKNTVEYAYLAQQVVRFQMQFQKIQNAAQHQHLAGLTQSAQFQHLHLATNFKSKIYFYQANATYQFVQGQVKKAYEINREFLDLLEANPHFLRLYAERYIATLNNMLIDSLVIGDYEVLKEGISRLVMTLQRPEFKSIKNIAARVFRQRYLLLINWSLSQRDFAKALAWIPKIEEGLAQFGKKIEKHHRITFYYLIAYLLFLNRQYDRALKWNNLILDDPKEDAVKEIFYFARILNLLLHYELGNHALLESLLASTPKYLKARRPIYATEKALFRYLGKLLHHPDKAEKQKLMADFKAEMDERFQQPAEKRVFNYLDLRLWV
ncbi:MAG: hypothetical protein DA408_12670 [Bacteroidetes bacterium]|nr:MAG: hypothetical protein C7N36_04100 [Bacteroidota bacterium]PTM11783.1 MAG: hypothetical protein DA408_12670 [Bacteroidota bacterium]